MAHRSGKHHSLARAHAALCAIILGLASLIGCGGGTTGSGDISTVKMYGSVTTMLGQPVESGTVSDLNSDASSQIGSRGTFEITATAEDGTVLLEVATSGTSGTIEIKDVNGSSQALTVQIVVDSVSGIVSLVSVEVTETPPTAAPSIPAANAKPTPPSVHSPSTADRPTRFIRGVITGSRGKPAKDVLVSIAGSRDTDTTDVRGRFAVTERSANGSLKLQLRYKGLVGDAVIRGVPTDRDCVLRVRISLSIEAGQNPGEGDEGGAKLSVDVESVSFS